MNVRSEIKKSAEIRAEEKKIEKAESISANRLNRIGPVANTLFNLIFVILALICIVPVFFVLDGSKYASKPFVSLYLFQIALELLYEESFLLVIIGAKAANITVKINNTIITSAIVYALLFLL